LLIEQPVLNNPPVATISVVAIPVQESPSPYTPEPDGYILGRGIGVIGGYLHIMGGIK